MSRKEIWEFAVLLPTKNNSRPHGFMGKILQNG